MAIARAVLVMSLVAVAAISCEIGDPPIGAEDARRLDMTIQLASAGSTFDERQAIALANENLGFTLSPDLRIDAALARVGGANNSSGHVAGLVWIVRYSGNVPIAVPEPSSVGADGPRLEVHYAYVLVDAISGEVLEITVTGA